MGSIEILSKYSTRRTSGSDIVLQGGVLNPVPYKIEDWILEEAETGTRLVAEDEIVTHLEKVVSSRVGTELLSQVVTDLNVFCFGLWVAWI